MFIDYKTFAIFKVSCSILLSYLDSAQIVKLSTASKCRSLIDSQIIIQTSPLDKMVFAPLKESTERVLT